MVDDRPDDIGPSPDPGRAKRAPPTIDLEATEVSSDTQNAGAGAEPGRSLPRPSAAAISAAIVAAISGASAAALVIGVAWLGGWTATTSPPVPAPQVNSAAIDDLAARIAGIESRISQPAAATPDPAAAARAEALEKSLAALRGELESQRAQSEKLAAAVNDAKSAPREAAPPVDLSADQRTHRPDRARRAGAERRDRQGRQQAGRRPAATPHRGGGPARRARSHRRSLCLRRWGLRKRWRRIRTR